MPGHADDHVCFFLEPDRLLFSGDNILGRGTTLIAKPEGDMVIYMDTLHRTRELNPVAIAPGHGPMILNPEAVIDEYVHHRQERERELLAALDAPQTVWELVDRIYSPPSEPIRQLASLSVEAQLAKLESERCVERLADGRYLIRADS
jgi:glyoxylase-like metal-dependent hydrolase (beta-lactamase superfamily II)